MFLCHVIPQSDLICSHLMSPSMASEFSDVNNSFVNLIEFPSPSVGPDELLILFISFCSDILDEVAPYKFRKYMFNSVPWLNNHTFAVRQECRKA